MKSCFVSGSCIPRNFGILHFGRISPNFSPEGKFYGADSKSETILYIRDQYQVHIGHFFVIFPLIKKYLSLHNNRVDMATNQAIDEQDVHFCMLSV